MTRGRLVMDTLVRSSSSSDMGGSKLDEDSSPCRRTPPILRVSPTTAAANKSNGSSSRSVSFSSEISVFVPDEEDGSPMSILSGRWVGNISSADAFQEVAVVQVKENVPCTLNGIRKRLPLVPFEKGSTMTTTSGREVPLGGSDSSIYRSPQRAKESNCDVDEPKPAPISPLSDSSFDLGLLNSGSLGNENEDDRPVSPVSTDSSFDIELYRRRCNMWTRIVDLLRVLLVFGLYVAQVLDTRLCNQHERMFLGIKTMGILIVCVLATIPTKDRRGRTGWTKLVEIVCSRKTCLLITYVFAWTYAVDAVSGLWSARSIDFAPCTGKETVLSGILERRSKLDGVISRKAPQSETNLDAPVIIDNDIASDDMEAAHFSVEPSASSEPRGSSFDNVETEVTSAGAVDGDAASDENEMIENETVEAEERDVVANAITEDEAVTSEAEQGAGAVNGTIGTSDSDAEVATGDSQITAETESNKTEEQVSIAEKTIEATAADEVVAPETAPGAFEEGIGSEDNGVLAKAQASSEPEEKGASSLGSDDIAPVNSAVETAAADVVTDATNELEPRQLPESFVTGEDSQIELDVSEAHEVGAGSSAMDDMVSADVESSSPEVEANDLHDDIDKAQFIPDDERVTETERASVETDAKDRYEDIEADTDTSDNAAIEGAIAAVQEERASLDTAIEDPVLASEEEDDTAGSVSSLTSPDEEVNATGVESNQTNDEASGELMLVPRQVPIVYEQAPLPETDGADQPPKRKPPARFTPGEANGESGPVPQVVYEQVPLPDTDAADELPRRKPLARFTPEEAKGELGPAPQVVYEQAPLPETDGADQPPKRKPPARFTPDEANQESGPAPQVVYEQVPLPDTDASDELPRRKSPERFTPEEANGESVPVPQVSMVYEQAPLPETDGADQLPKRKPPARFTPDEASGESGPAPQVVYEQVPLPDTGAADELPRRKPPARFTPEEASGESVPVPRVSIVHDQAPLPETDGADQPPKRKPPVRFTPEEANRESGPAPQVVYEQVPLPDTGAADKLPRRKPPARFTPPFLTKIMKESTLNNWSVRDTTDRLNGRALFEFHHSGVGHWVTPMADSNNDPTVNRALHSVALSVVAVVVTNTLRHCSAFLLGVDGSYKNQAMMDALSEVWISKFWS